MKDCVSLETAKRLKEAGWPQDKLRQLYEDEYRFWWWAVHDGKKFALMDRPRSDDDLCFAAPTIGNLLGSLPDRTELKRIDNTGTEFTWFALHDDLSEATGARSDSPADALAELWMKLKTAE